jgi:phosphoribosylamine---glycine ligase
MKFLLRTGCGESLPIALRLMDEGNEVVFALSEEADRTYAKIGEGLVVKGDFKKALEWADCVVFDSNIFELPREAEMCREKGIPTLGSSKLSGFLENDRAYAVETANQVGLNVREYEEFVGASAWVAAERYIKSLPTNSRWVWKPNGESPVSTFVSDSIEQLSRMFLYWKALYEEHKEIPNFIITEKIEGQEISTEGWFNGKDFYFPNHTLERTRFFDGDHGEKTGCAGNVVWLHDGPLFHTLVEPMREILRGKYNGPLDINAIIDEETNEPIFLEYTPRFGYDAIFGLMQILDSDLGELFFNIAKGLDWTGNIRSDFAGMVRLHIPPYPEPPSDKDKQRPVGLPIDGVKMQDKVGPFYPVEVFTEEDALITAGPDGYVMVVGGNGDTPEEAMNAAYRRADSVTIPCVRYRLDLADKLQEVYHLIKMTGWLGEKQLRTVFTRRS